MRQYLVSASHTTELLACREARAWCFQESWSGRWCAHMTDYGCSIEAATPEAAIRALLTSHGCTDIRIVLEGLWKPAVGQDNVAMGVPQGPIVSGGYAGGPAMGGEGV